MYHFAIMYALLLLLAVFSQIQCRYVISVYGDVYEDQDFFGRTFPWIIDNIGGDINVDYFLLGSGRYSVPQMCVLNELKMNTFLQAQYLKCEAEGNPSDKCICETGIDPEKYKTCVQTKGSYAGMSAAKFAQLGIDASPIVEIGYKNTVFGVEDTWYLKKICTIFGDSPPRGCVKPFSCNNTNTFSERKGIAVYNCPNCQEDIKIKISIYLYLKNMTDTATTAMTTTSTTPMTKDYDYYLTTESGIYV